MMRHPRHRRKPRRLRQKLQMTIRGSHQRRGRPPTVPDWRTLRRVRDFIIMIRTEDEMNKTVGESQPPPRF